MIMYTSRDQDVIQDGETYTTADGKVLTMKKIRGGTVHIMGFFSVHFYNFVLLYFSPIMRY